MWKELVFFFSSDFIDKDKSFYKCLETIFSSILGITLILLISKMKISLHLENRLLFICIVSIKVKLFSMKFDINISVFTCSIYFISMPILLANFSPEFWNLAKVFLHLFYWFCNNFLYDFYAVPVTLKGLLMSKQQILGPTFLFL